MFIRKSARAFAWAAASCALAFTMADPAVARKSARPSTRSTGIVEQIPIPVFASSPQVQSRPRLDTPQYQARFFTINDALTRRDNGTVKSTDSARVRMASVGPEDAVFETAMTRIPTGNEPFGLTAFRAPEGVLWSKWRTIRDAMAMEDARLTNCYDENDDCSTEASKFTTLVTDASKFSGRARLEAVNRMVNASVRYASDMALHGQLDRWTAPLATLRAGKGDCEDYAILKYRILREIGVKPEDLKILLVRDTAVRIDHAVLAVRHDDTWFILDNRNRGFYEEQDLPHYAPLFALDQNGVKLFAAPFASTAPLEMPSLMLPGFGVDLPEPADDAPEASQ